MTEQSLSNDQQQLAADDLVREASAEVLQLILQQVAAADNVYATKTTPISNEQPEHAAKPNQPDAAKTSAAAAAAAPKRSLKRKNNDENKENTPAAAAQQPAVPNKRKRGANRKLDMTPDSPDIQTKEKEVILFLSKSLFGQQTTPRTPLQEVANNNNLNNATAGKSSSSWSSTAATAAFNHDQNATLRMTCESDVSYDRELNSDFSLQTFQVNTSHLQDNHHLVQLARFNQQQQSVLNAGINTGCDFGTFVDVNNNNVDLNNNNNSGGVLNTPTDMNKFSAACGQLLYDYSLLTAPENFLSHTDELGFTVIRAQSVNNNQSVMSVDVSPPPAAPLVAELAVPAQHATAAAAATAAATDDGEDFFDDNDADSELDEQLDLQKPAKKNDVFFEGRNLSKIEGTTSGVYAYNVAKVLFTEDELDKGTFPTESKYKGSSKRTPLDPHRTMILKEAVCNKFSIAPADIQKFWNDVRSKLNTKLCKKYNDKMKKLQQA